MNEKKMDFKRQLISVFLMMFVFCSNYVSSLLVVPKSTNPKAEWGLARRRLFDLGLIVSIGVTSRPAEAVPNPLNLKGSFWETGELYTKSKTEVSSDPQELLEYLVQTAAALQKLTDVVTAGKFGDLSRLLRGGAISESQIRLRAYALIDQIEDETQEYKASESFRLFLQDFDALDRTVEAASRQTKLDGGFTETLGLAVVAPLSAASEVARIASEPNFGRDPRILVLAVLQETTKALQTFNKAAGEALQQQS